MLIEECKRLRDLRIQEQADFAGMSEDKERLNLLWAQTKKQLEDTKADVRERYRQRIALSEEHAAEIKARSCMITEAALSHRVVTRRCVQRHEFEHLAKRDFKS